MPSAAAPGRSARDTKLALAAGILILAGLLELVADSLRLSELLNDAGISVETMVAGWLEVIRALPALTAVALALVAFVAAGEARRRWLRGAFLLAALAYGISAIVGILSMVALTGPTPRGYGVAVGAGMLSEFALFLGALLAASAFGALRSVERREAILRRAAQAVAVGFGFAAISAFEYAVAYARYHHHNDFVGGLVIQGLGSLAVAVAVGVGASAFKRRGEGVGDELRLATRERRLSHAAIALVLSFLVVALGEAQTAAGATAVGYSESSAVAGWVFVAGRVAYAAAVACAAVGFSRATARRG